jgi:hypothetical protein
VLPEGLCKWKNPINITGNKTRDLPAWSAVLQPTALLFNQGTSVYLEVREGFLNVNQTKFVVESVNFVGKKNRSLHSGGE